MASSTRSPQYHRAHRWQVRRRVTGNDTMMLQAERTYRILYAGPALSGRTTNLKYVSAQTDPAHRLGTERVPFESSYSLQTSFVHPYGEGATPCHVVLIATPGPVGCPPLDKEVARVADGIVFVIDSQTARVDAGLESIQSVEEHLRAGGRKLNQIPCVLQYNKRDLREIETINSLQRHMNKAEWPAYEAVARTGKGIIQTLDEMLRRLTGHAFRPLVPATPDRPI